MSQASNDEDLDDEDLRDEVLRDEALPDDALPDQALPDARDLPSATAASTAETPAWGAIISMMLGVFGLVTAEFLPASLLTPIARDLHVTEGLAGQAVTATAGVALVTSLLVATVTRGLDRRVVLLAFSALLIASNLLVAAAPSLPLLVLGRVLLGVALGGFWTLAAATTMRLAPAAHIPRALSVIFSGVSAATIFAAPFGSYVGDVAGWRAVFLMAAGLGALALAAQFATLPKMAPHGHTRLRTLIDIVRRPQIGLGVLAIILVFTGHFALFTYVRPFLETVAGVGVTGVSAILLGFGLANFLGTLLGGVMLERSLRLTLTVMPLAMGAIGLALAGWGSAPLADAILIALWGLAFGAVPVAWSTWTTRAAPDEAESAGGLLVAAIQLAIATGAATGGLFFDASGARGVFSAGGLVLLAATLIILVGVRSQPATEAA